MRQSWHTELFKGFKILSLYILAVGFISLTGSASVFTSQHISIRGYGFWGNLSLHKDLKILDNPNQKRTLFDANYIEDAIWVLDGSIQAKGYPHPTFEIEVTTTSGEKKHYTWDKTFTPDIDPHILATHINFQINPGILNHYTSLTITGIPDEKMDKLVHYFYPTNVLVVTKEDKYFTPARFEQSIESLLRDIKHNGYWDARLIDKEHHTDSATGATTASVHISRGPRYFVDQLTIKRNDETLSEESVNDEPYTHAWRYKQMKKLRNEYYAEGYPDVEVKTTNTPPKYKDEKALVNITNTITPGPQVTVHNIEYQGMGKTDKKIVKGNTPLEEGELLDIQKAEAQRDRLLGLNIFKNVDLDYNKVSEHEWDVLYIAELKQSLILSLIMGYGSYELLRLGFELRHNNIFGRAHYSKLKFIQSFKSTEVDYRYNIPEFLGKDITGFGNANFLTREEISYTRQELSASAGVNKYLKRYKTYATFQYNYEQLKALKEDFPRDVGLNNANVSSLQLDLRRSTIDNPLFPERGYRIYGSTEIAIPHLGGNVDFERFELGAAYHHPITSAFIGHYALRHGFVTTVGSVPNNLPINKRFYPGGDTTVRGYRQGQADPQDDKGNNIGAETYVLLNIEFEERLSQKLSFVVFLDAVGFARSIHDYPFNQELYSLGLGLNYRTPVGPLRLEYAHNIHRRPDDPSGRLLLALGFPF
ncbi:MAG: hypothetical protein Tsb0018_07040 [Opitutales bacterium]